MKYMILIGILPMMFLTACVTNKKVPSPKAFPNNVYGSFCIIDLDTGVVKGELLAIDSAGMTILTNAERTSPSQIISIERSKVVTAEVHVSSTSNAGPSLITWAAFIPFLSIAHGGYAVISLPVNIISTGVIIRRINQDFYGFIYPDHISWDGLVKFARFPQGIPAGIPLESIR